MRRYKPHLETCVKESSTVKGLFVESIYDEIDDDIDGLDEEEHREAFLGFFKNSFPFLLCPTLVRRSEDLPDLDWVQVKYSDHQNHTFPDQQGVYIFMVSFKNANLPENSYVMYVGKAGDTDSNNTIANRFYDYVNKSGYYRRSRVKKLIKHFSDHLVYHYATIPNGQSTATIEQILADVFVPPCCQMDFSAEVRTLLRGVRL